MGEDNSKLIKLTVPLEIVEEDGSTTFITELKPGRMKLKHLRIMPKELFNMSQEEEEGEADMSALIPVVPKLVSALCNIPEEHADLIDIADLEAILENLGSFLGSAQAITGNK